MACSSEIFSKVGISIVDSRYVEPGNVRPGDDETDKLLDEIAADFKA